MSNLFLRRTIVACTPWATLAVAATVSTAAHAHLGTAGGLAHSHGALDSFVAGAAHPLTGLDHLAAMLSVGLWSALGASSSSSPKTSTARLWTAPLAFAGTLLAGAVLALNGLSLPGIEPMIAASLLILGLLVASRTQLPTGAGAALVAGFALFHGLAHGQELGGHAIAALSGMVLSTIALHAAGIATGLALQRQRSRWLPRIAGAGVAAFGLSLMAPAAASIF